MEPLPPTKAPEPGPASQRLPRFTRTERAVHWVHALAFLALLGSGLVIFVPSLSALVGHRPVVRQLHILMGFALVLGPLVLAILGNRRAVWEDVREVDRWDDDDFAWLERVRKFFFGGMVRAAPQGKFNAGQKLNAIFTAATIAGFAATGFVMWQFKRFPVWLVENANVFHDWLTIAAALAWLGHVYLAVLHPSTRESLRGITLGWVRRGWAQEHHQKWHDRTAGKR